MKPVPEVESAELRRDIAAWIAARVAPDVVDDLTQEVFLRLSARAADDAIRSLAAYARRVARSVVADHHRVRGRRKEVELEAEPIVDEEPSAEPGALLARWVAAQIDHLPPEVAHAVRECELRGRSHASVAQELGVPRSTVSSRVQRGRSELLRRLYACCRVEREGGAVTACTPRTPGCR